MRVHAGFSSRRSPAHGDHDGRQSLSGEGERADMLVLHDVGEERSDRSITDGG